MASSDGDCCGDDDVDDDEELPDGSSALPDVLTFGVVSGDRDPGTDDTGSDVGRSDVRGSVVAVLPVDGPAADEPDDATTAAVDVLVFSLLDPLQPTRAFATTTTEATANAHAGFVMRAGYD